jgi:hypothetical protein
VGGAACGRRSRGAGAAAAASARGGTGSTRMVGRRVLGWRSLEPWGRPLGFGAASEAGGVGAGVGCVSGVGASVGAAVGASVGASVVSDSEFSIYTTLYTFFEPTTRYSVQLSLLQFYKLAFYMPSPSSTSSCMLSSSSISSSESGSSVKYRRGCSSHSECLSVGGMAW